MTALRKSLDDLLDGSAELDRIQTASRRYVAMLAARDCAPDAEDFKALTAIIAGTCFHEAVTRRGFIQAGR